MEETWSLAALWMGLALLSLLIGARLRLSIALVEICVGVAAQAALVGLDLPDGLSAGTPWIGFLASTGAVVLTFLAGAEIETRVLRRHWKEAVGIGLASFAGPFLGCAALARFVLGWDPAASWLAGVALSTTSMAVVYAVMLETGLNRTEFGKTLLAATFVTDLGTVLALGILFAPMTWHTLAFGAATAVACLLLPRWTRRLFWFWHLTERTKSELETKFLMLVLFALGALAAAVGSEAVLPAYLVGLALADSVGRDHDLLRRLRTMTIGLLTPFYFLRAGSYVSLPALAAAPFVFLALFAGKSATKFGLVWPAAKLFRYPRKEAAYLTLLMSTGLTFGTISSLYGLTRGIVTQGQYSLLVATVIASAVVPTLIANLLFHPKHLLEAPAAPPVGRPGLEPGAAVNTM